MLLYCGGYSCQRMISVSVIPGGNPAARKDPEHFSITYAVCADCRTTYCDRCMLARPGPAGPLGGCRRCDGELLDGSHRESLAARRYPEPVLRFNEGTELAGEGRHQDALAAFERAVAGRATYYAAHQGRARALVRLGRHDEADAAYDTLLGLDPTNVSAILEKADGLSDRQQLDAAAAWFDRALRLSPLHMVALARLASVLNASRRYEEALDAARRVSELSRDTRALGVTAGLLAYASNVRAMALLNLGRNEEALAAADEAIESGPDIPLHYEMKALALERLGRAAEADLARRLEAEAAGRSGR
ncbi:tetratricopeptide repeat protein [Parafrankia sp. FMc2]|uniref:tetratricopeptide repeat protein n=1 Tax=Parafrankia sp. FMc2 TaxID=3233196 RepID=UPI0034D5F838